MRLRNPLARLWYLLLLLLATATVVIGFWPSILTLFAVLAIPIAVSALLGLVRPIALTRRPRVLRAVRWGAYALCTEWVLLLGWYTWSQRRSVTLTVQSPQPARARVVFEVEDGHPRRLTAWHREFAVPATGIVHTQYSADRGWDRPTARHPLRVRIVDAASDTVPGAGEWLRGGFVRTAGCEFQYDEYAVWSAAGPRPDSSTLAPVNWLDSLPNWGVDCVHGRLRRSQDRRQAAFPAPDQACYYEKSGGVACHSGAHSAP